MTVIEGIQPFNAGYEPLGTLDRLVRVDKHRVLLLCVGFFEFIPRIDFYRGNKLVLSGYGRAVSMDFSAGRPPLTSQEPVHVEVEGEGTILVAFKDPPVPGLPVLETLAEIVKCVADIIPPFDPFF
jgi:hypothetical protein